MEWALISCMWVEGVWGFIEGGAPGSREDEGKW